MHKKTAETLKTEINESYQNAAEYGTPEDWLDTYKIDMLNKGDIFALQLQKIFEEIKTLERINSSKILDNVAFGSVVFTNTQKFFISIGIGKIIVDNEVYFAISSSVPLFHAIQGLKAGDTFEFRETKDKILDVFLLEFVP